MLRWPIRNPVLNAVNTAKQIITGRNAVEEILGFAKTAPQKSVTADTIPGSAAAEPIRIRDLSSKVLLLRACRKACAALRQAVAESDKGSVETHLARVAHLQRLFQLAPALGAMGPKWLAKRCYKTAERWSEAVVAESIAAGLAEPGKTRGVHSTTFLRVKVNKGTQELMALHNEQREAYEKVLQKRLVGKGHLHLGEADLPGMTDRMRSIWQSHFGRAAFWRSKYKVPVSHPDMDRIMRYCKNGNTRDRIFTEYYDYFGTEVNKAALDLLRTRQDLAKQLGFRSWAHYQLSPLAISSPEEAHRLLDKCWKDAQPTLTPMLRQMEALANQPRFRPSPSGPLSCLSQVDEKYYHISAIREAATWQLKEYFPVKDSLPALLDFLGKSYNVHLVEVTDTQAAWQTGWHKGVKIYKVKDGSVPKESSKHLGYIYLDATADLYLRASWLMRPEVNLAGAAYLCPGHAYVSMGFIEDRMGLFNDEQMMGIAHELGHALHALCMQQAAAAFDEMPLDIVELPSVLAETMALHPGVIMQYASHHKSKAPPSDTLLHSSQRNVYFYVKYLQNYNVVLGLHGENFDAHAASPEDVQQTAVALWQKFSPVPAHPSYHPFGGESGLYLGNGANHIGYLLCYLRVEKILFRKGFDKKKSWQKVAQEWVQPDFQRQVREELLDRPIPGEQLAAKAMPVLGGDPSAFEHPLPPPPLDTSCLFQRLQRPAAVLAAVS